MTPEWEPRGLQRAASGAVLCGSLTEGDLRRAIDYFTEATRIDPKYALAWAELGRRESGLASEFLGGAAARETHARARAAVLKALALDPQLAFAHVAHGYVLVVADFDWRGAEAEARRALALSPRDPEMPYFVGYVLASTGRVQEAIALAQQETAPPYRSLADALVRQVSPDRSAADAALKILVEKDSGVAAYQIAEVYALRGDANATFQWLDRAWGNRDPGINYLLYDPFILRFKDDPRFAAFCRKVGLPVPGQAPTST